MKMAKLVLPEMLETGIPFAEAASMAAAYDEPLTGYAFIGADAVGQSFVKAEWKGCTFKNVRFTGADFEGATWQNVMFDTCDFSGVKALEATLQKCMFRDCRLTGAQFATAGVNDVSFIGCAADMVCFAEALLKNVQFTDCRLQNAVFADLRPRSVFAFDACNLMRAEFLHTPLKGQNLTTCDIDGISLEGKELRGAVVTALQACELARLLGVVIQ